MVGRRLDEVPRLVPLLVDGLPEGLGAIAARRPFREREASTDHAAPLEEEDEVVQPVDEQSLDVLGFAGELVALAFDDRIDAADQVEEGEAGRREELGPVGGADDETDVGLVLEGLPGQM